MERLGEENIVHFPVLISRELFKQFSGLITLENSREERVL